jgi:uncharacterized protein (DUF362 family)
MLNSSNKVWVVRTSEPKYKDSEEKSLKENLIGAQITNTYKIISRLFKNAGFDLPNYGTPEWNPLGSFISVGDSVVLKPNWVSHHNQSGQGLDCLVTNASVLGTMIDFSLRAKPRRIIVGDAPIQGCDLLELMDAAGYNALKQLYPQDRTPVNWVDFRRTILHKLKGVRNRYEDVRPINNYTLFDLGCESLLEPISDKSNRFRVTMYNPDLMFKTHAQGRHQYLVAKEILEADVFINIPKLKTHKKACITAALKNIVGINGNKEYLPHHRRGGSQIDGDCYLGWNLLKLLSEYLSDGANRREGIWSYMFRQASRGTYGLARILGSNKNIDGSWYGNDTIWRTCLDLNRILRFGRLDGSMANLPQRKLLTLTDAIVCGEGEGPLASTPHPLGILTLATNSVAADYVHAHLMRFDWRKIPLIYNAFGQFRYPICDFRPNSIEVQFEGEWFHQPWPLWNNNTFIPPEGWKNHCTL